MSTDNTMSLDAYQSLLARQDAEEKKTKRKRKTEHAESNLQRACVTYFRTQYPNDALMLFAVPNGGGRSVVEASIMKAEGVTAGVSDLLLLEARGGWGCLCLEAKTKKKGSGQSKDKVFRTFEEFKTIVDDYMALPAGVGRRVVVRGSDLEAERSGRMQASFVRKEDKGDWIDPRFRHEVF